MANVDLILPAPQAFPKLKDKAGPRDKQEGRVGNAGSERKNSALGSVGKEKVIKGPSFSCAFYQG